MPDFIQSIQSQDIGHLRIVAAFWGLELKAARSREASTELGQVLKDSALVREVVEALPSAGRAALAALVAQGGRMPWAVFIRCYGDVREMGAGRRDREKPYLQPVSSAEILWYRGLLARAFFDTHAGAQEFAYIPDDLLPRLPAMVELKGAEPLGRAAKPAEHAIVLQATDRILDDACTLLVALRLGWQSPPFADAWPYPVDFLKDLMLSAHLIHQAAPMLEPVKTFLELPRGESLALLVSAWLNSDTINELRRIPDLLFEGQWRNDPLATRHRLLDFLSAVPRGQWWSLGSFVQDVHQRFPDFQRPAGDYDSWFIRRKADGEYLRGFACWDAVDGALIRHFITGFLHWLRVVDLATTSAGAPPTAFRIVNAQLLSGHSPTKSPAETGRLKAASNGRILIPRLLPRTARYQIARFCEWEEERAGEYIYRVTPASLLRAREQGLKVAQLLALLRKHAAAPLPPAFVRALQRWEMHGSEAALANLVVLRVANSAVLKELRGSKAGRFLGEPLGPAAVAIKPGAVTKVIQALAEMGLLVEDLTRVSDAREISEKKDKI